MNRVIFFDVDGPMVSGRASLLPENVAHRYGWKFDPCAVAMLNFIGFALPDVRVVIASHRVGMRAPTTSGYCEKREDWVEIFKHNELNLQIHEDWITVRAAISRPKFDEISGWLLTHPDTTFVTIDDEAAGYDKKATLQQRHQFHLCGESYTNGITYEDFVRMCDYLGIKNLDSSLDKYYRKHLTTTRSPGHEKGFAGTIISANS